MGGNQTVVANALYVKIKEPMCMAPMGKMVLEIF